MGEVVRISPTILQNELSRTLGGIDAEIMNLKARAAEMDINPLLMRDATGGFMMAPLLIAKTQALHALTLLQQS